MGRAPPHAVSGHPECRKLCAAAEPQAGLADPQPGQGPQGSGWTAATTRLVVLRTPDLPCGTK